jgi:hypothetical protein
MDLPPLIKIAIEERLWESQSPQALKDKLIREGLDSEFSAQADWTIAQFPYVGEPDSDAGFVVIPSGSLNPFSPVAKCFAESCTAEATDDFIKSVGLYSERAVISDPLTSHFVEGHERTDYCYESVFRSVKILKKLEPLISSGVLLLATPVRRYCKECRDEADAVLSEATEALLSLPHEYKARLFSKNQRYELAFEVPVLQPDHEHPLRKSIQITKADAALLRRVESPASMSKTSKNLLRSIVAKSFRNDLSKILFDLEMARGMGSLMLAGSRAETLVISTLDRKAPSLAQLEDWERLRTVHLPWVANLTTHEVLTLRGEASTALPRLRELLRTQLATPSHGSTSLTEKISELRAQALEVQSELDALHLPRERNYRAGMVGLAMAFVVYGIASQSPPLVGTSIAALLATFAHLRSAEREHDTETTKLVSTPAYALLKAKEILSRR